jgi:hypothetical protein
MAKLYHAVHQSTLRIDPKTREVLKMHSANWGKAELYGRRTVTGPQNGSLNPGMGARHSVKRDKQTGQVLSAETRIQYSNGFSLGVKGTGNDSLDFAPRARHSAILRRRLESTIAQVSRKRNISISEATELVRDNLARKGAFIGSLKGKPEVWQIAFGTYAKHDKGTEEYNPPECSMYGVGSLLGPREKNQVTPWEGINAGIESERFLRVSEVGKAAQSFVRFLASLGWRLSKLTEEKPVKARSVPETELGRALAAINEIAASL